MKNVMKGILIFLTLFFVGCGTIQTFSEGKEVRALIDQRKDPAHVYSCGPIALEKILRHFSINTNRKAISYAIQKKGHPYRAFYSIFDSRAREITFRSEIKHILKLFNLEMREVKSLSVLDAKKDIAIVLIHRSMTLEYHWAVYPIDTYFENFFGKCTIIDEIYLIERK
tara:strand:- start:146 stop:652 length:507 start_codon:yes stop_codon:yes gene_type:complete